MNNLNASTPGAIALVIISSWLAMSWSGGLHAATGAGERHGDESGIEAAALASTGSVSARAGQYPLGSSFDPAWSETTSMPEMRLPVPTGSLPTDPWVEITNLPQVLMDNRAVCLAGAVYSIGGTNGINAYSNVYAYDTASEDSWVSVASLPESRQALAAGVIDNKIVVNGGWGGHIR